MNHNLNILIVEDDFIISTDLQFRLEEMGYEVSGVCVSAEETIAFLKENTVDFAIFDINIKGQTDGIDLASIVSRHYKIPFVFLTSLVDQEFVERAKKVRPSAYMLKPFNEQELRIAIELAISNYSAGKTAEIADSKTKEEALDKEEAVHSPVQGVLFLKKQHKYFKIALENIMYVEADGNYTIIHTTTGDFIYSTVLRKIEEKLPEEMFMRVHRSYVVNVNHIDGVSGNMITVDKSEIPVSRNYREDFWHRFDFIK